MAIENKVSKYPTKRQFEEWKTKINTVDHVATDFFNVYNVFGFRFNYNFRWYWAQAIKPLHLKMFKDIPLKEKKIILQIHLN